MFSLFNKKSKTGKQLKFKISGMHCVSCALNIDDSLEEVAGVIESKTSYARGETLVVVKPSFTDDDTLKKTIADLGYQLQTD